MTASPKRKSDDTPSSLETKKPRLAEDEDAESNRTPADVAPDAQIDHKKAIEYWSSTEASVSGVLGGYPQVSRIDLQGSSNFFAKLKRQAATFKGKKKLARVVDCGAGIGRVTDGFLSKVAETVDIVEPVKSFTDQVKSANAGEIFNVGLEDWTPAENVKYDMVWNQWCVGQLTDVQLVDYLKRIQPSLSEGGLVIVKENLSNHPEGADVFDDEDNSVTRTDVKFRSIFEDAGLRLVSTELQRGFPQGLYPVRMYALQPKTAGKQES